MLIGNLNLTTLHKVYTEPKMNQINIIRTNAFYFVIGAVSRWQLSQEGYNE